MELRAQALHAGNFGFEPRKSQVRGVKARVGIVAAEACDPEPFNPNLKP